MNIIFWNTNKNNNINQYLKKIVINQNADIVVLAEYNDNIKMLNQELYLKGYYFEECEILACKKIKIIHSKDMKVEICDDNSNYVSITINNKKDNIQLFPSKLHTSDDNRQLIASQLKDDIDKYDKAIIVGDFNSNPFEKTIIAASCLSALPSKKKLNRCIHGKEYSNLYNPMWRFFNDFEKYPGTYYYDNSDDINYYWHMFDQVLISSKLNERFEENSLKIIQKINKKSLIKNEKIDKNISDHLPIFFSIREENNNE